MTYKSFFLAAVLLCLMPLTVGAQGTDINSRDLRGQVFYQDDEVVFRQLDEQTWIGNGHRVYNESLYLVDLGGREILDGERKPIVSNGNNGGMDMMVDDKGVRINFSSRSGMK